MSTYLFIGMLSPKGRRKSIASITATEREETKAWQSRVAVVGVSERDAGQQSRTDCKKSQPGHRQTLSQHRQTPGLKQS